MYGESINENYTKNNVNKNVKCTEKNRKNVDLRSTIYFIYSLNSHAQIQSRKSS